LKIALVTADVSDIHQRAMMAKGYHVVMACRNELSGRRALEEVKREFPEGSVEMMLVDVGSLASIADFAKAFTEKHSRLDVLAHNAGVYFFDSERRKSIDGIELNLAVHVIGPYALTARLFSVLKNTPNSRVVSMSSTEHHGSASGLCN